MESKAYHSNVQLPHTELHPEIKAEILAQPLYRQNEIKRFIPASDSAFEQGRIGRGALAGLKFSRVGRMVFYKAGDLIEYLERLPSIVNVASGDVGATLGTGTN